jgi:hypothetical protein
MEFVVVGGRGARGRRAAWKKEMGAARGAERAARGVARVRACSRGAGAAAAKAKKKLATPAGSRVVPLRSTKAAQRCLTSEFGMGSGSFSAVWSQATCPPPQGLPVGAARAGGARREGRGGARGGVGGAGRRWGAAWGAGWGSRCCGWCWCWARLAGLGWLARVYGR